MFKIFFTHASPDREIVRKLRDLLILGVGLSHDQIFCSSIEGDIPNGMFFVQHILQRLRNANVIVAVLSRSYFKSEFCVAEAGAAQVHQIAAAASFYSLIVPPAGFSDLNGVLYGVQSDLIVNRGALDGLRDRVAPGVSNPPPTSTWNEKRDGFLADAEIIVARGKASDLLEGLAVCDVFTERSDRVDITYKSKLRVILRNETGENLDIRQPTRKAELRDVRAQLPHAARLQLEGLRGWEAGDWQSQEYEALHLPIARAMRVWVGLDPSIGDLKLRRRHENKRLGTLALQVKVAGYEFPVEIRL